MPSYSTVCAAVNRDHPMLLLALRSGIDAYRHYLPVLENSIVGRNAVWYIDETKLPVRTIGRDGVATEAVWLVSVLDGATRLVLAHLVVEGAVNALHATSVLAAAALGWMHENERVGGRPEALVSDNALIYKSNDFARCTAALGIPHLFAQPHSPGGKARIERWHRTIKDSGLSYLPGWSRGPRDTVHLTEPDPHTGRTVREVRHLMPPDHALLPVDDVAGRSFDEAGARIRRVIVSASFDLTGALLLATACGTPAGPPGGVSPGTSGTASANFGAQIPLSGNFFGNFFEGNFWG